MRSVICIDTIRKLIRTKIFSNNQSSSIVRLVANKQKETRRNVHIESTNALNIAWLSHLLQIVGTVGNMRFSCKNVKKKIKNENDNMK